MWAGTGKHATPYTGDPWATHAQPCRLLYRPAASFQPPTAASNWRRAHPTRRSPRTVPCASCSSPSHRPPATGPSGGRPSGRGERPSTPSPSTPRTRPPCTPGPGGGWRVCPLEILGQASRRSGNRRGGCRLGTNPRRQRVHRPLRRRRGKPHWRKSYQFSPHATEPNFKGFAKTVDWKV